ncbi:MAG TPA: TIGR03067 domain-containing protein [Gemmataceae bacterium]|jgi:uncharacterized protein (TIGR03067 family)|nr:TIGR03067 domain-containing protein [Gemmataceae bacterium]
MTARLLLAAVLIAAPGVKEKPTPKPEEVTPTGAWVAEKVEQGGKDVLPTLDGLTMTFRDGTVVLRMRNRDHPMPVTFNPIANAKEINIRPAFGPAESRGIYKIEGDTLTIYLNEVVDGERPTDFTPGAPNHTWFVLKRARK